MKSRKTKKIGKPIKNKLGKKRRGKQAISKPEELLENEFEDLPQSWTSMRTWLPDYEEIDPHYFSGDEEETDNEQNDESEDDTEGVKKAISGTYSYCFGDEDENDAQVRKETQGDSKIFDSCINRNAFQAKPFQIANEKAREIMWKQVTKEYTRTKKQFRHNPTGSYLRCSEGENYMSDEYYKNHKLNRFLCCPIPHVHCVSFRGTRIKQKIADRIRFNCEPPSFRRPPHWNFRKRYPLDGRMRTIPLEVDCKSCDRYAFTHDLRPDAYYENYVNIIKYNGINPEARPFEEVYNEMLVKWEKCGNRKRPKKKKAAEKKDSNNKLPKTPPKKRERNSQASSSLFTDTISSLMKKKAQSGSIQNGNPEPIMENKPEIARSSTPKTPRPSDKNRTLFPRELSSKKVLTSSTSVPNTSRRDHKTVANTSQTDSSTSAQRSLSISRLSYQGTIASERKKRLTNANLFHKKMYK